MRWTLSKASISVIQILKAILVRDQNKKKDSCKESLHLLREYHHKQNVDIIVDSEVHSGEISEGVKEHYWTIEKR